MFLPLNDQHPENIANHDRYFEKQGLSGLQRAVANLVHGANVERVSVQSPYRILETDAIITTEPNIVLALTVADCFPVYFEEHEAGIIGLAHCGWRGITRGIIPATLHALSETAGKMKTVHLTIGPGICARHFEVQNDVLPDFAPYREFIIHDKKTTIDLKGVIKRQALDVGVAPENITDQNECTYCLHEKYFSYRRDHPAYMEAQLASMVQQP